MQPTGVKHQRTEHTCTVHHTAAAHANQETKLGNHELMLHDTHVVKNMRHRKVKKMYQHTLDPLCSNPIM